MLFEIPGFGGTHRPNAFVARRTEVAGTPFVYVLLNPECSLGHHVFADSPCNGPWGRALVEELIPHLESRYPIRPGAAARLRHRAFVGRLEQPLVASRLSGRLQRLLVHRPGPGRFPRLPAGRSRTPRTPTCSATPPASPARSPAGTAPRRCSSRAFPTWRNSSATADNCRRSRPASVRGTPTARRGKCGTAAPAPSIPKPSAIGRSTTSTSSSGANGRRWRPSSAANCTFTPAPRTPSTWKAPCAQLKATLAELGSDAVVEIHSGKDHGSLMTAELRQRIARKSPRGRRRDIRRSLRGRRSPRGRRFRLRNGGNASPRFVGRWRRMPAFWRRWCARKSASRSKTVSAKSCTRRIGSAGCAGSAPRALRPERVGTWPLLHLSARVERRPLGTVAAITPWNYPIALTVGPVAAALAAGCTVVLKPSEHVAETALRLQWRWRKAGGPPGTFEILRGGPAQAAELAGHPGIAKVFFTGGAEGGRAILAAAATNLTPTVLELGGCDAAIVLADADLERTARESPGGRSSTAGSRASPCVAALPKPRSPGSWRKPSPVTPRRCGTVRATISAARTDAAANPRQASRLCALIVEAERLVARILVPPGGGDEFPPTVLAEVPAAARVLRRNASDRCSRCVRWPTPTKRSS